MHFCSNLPTTSSRKCTNPTIKSEEIVPTRFISG
ncbi:Uncharacterized protein BM_BM1408 [Brugia malayi]|uniref:Bm1408 n=1 Tax=Brugia malayi TaxID=6279 RepID=A0A0H5S8H4_BRUMA|nr:Uncharacterized protein BM_BM1408 [Brugia malayi]CRZ24891.1 Bm1408 [Brugia malayi]VIO93704.1 Uncharacterized protein BM_BM1408 [Brugia malayi]